MGRRAPPRQKTRRPRTNDLQLKIFEVFTGGVARDQLSCEAPGGRSSWN